MSGSTQPTKHVKVSKGGKVAVRQTVTQSTSAPDDLQNMPRVELEKEVGHLRTMVAAMKRSETMDQVSGLTNRNSFLNAANAEFNRTRRYGHDLTLCVVDIIGLSKVTRDHGLKATDHVVMAVSQMTVSSSRFGVDILGRISENQIAVILPETPLAGGLKFMQRMRKIVAETPIMLENGEQIKPGLKVSTDLLREDDTSFMQLFDRTWKKTPLRKVKATQSAA